MSLLKTQPSMVETKTSNTDSIGAVEDAHNRSVTVRKIIRKIKEGTDGIDATDERNHHDRLTEGFQLLSGDD